MTPTIYDSVKSLKCQHFDALIFRVQFADAVMQRTQPRENRDNLRFGRWHSEESIMTNFEPHQRELDELNNRLHSECWAPHVTVQNLVRNWSNLSRNVDNYRMTIDDYTNDLTSRDALALVVTWASPDLRDALAVQIADSDEDFLARTLDDDGRSVGRFFRPRNDDGWWWRRTPTTGPLATYLKQVL